MNKSLPLLIVIAVLFLSACNNHTTEKAKKEYIPLEITVKNPTQITLNDSTREALIVKGKWLSKQLKYALKAELHKSVTTNGEEVSIGFCNNRAFKITDSVSSSHQVMIKRAALKNRNPLNGMNEDETRIYKDFVIAWISKAPIHGRIIVNELNQPVYYNVMVMNRFCLKCHGSAEDINPEVAKKIKEFYPNDKATDIALKQPRGMWEITFPEYYVK